MSEKSRTGRGEKDWNPKRGTDPRLRHGGLAPSQDEYRERQEKRREADRDEERKEENDDDH